METIQHTFHIKNRSSHSNGNLLSNSRGHGVEDKGMDKNTKGSFVWQVKQSAEPEKRTVTVVSKNCPGIFSKIVGVFTLNGFDIFNARSYRQRDSTLDIFKIRAIPGQKFDEKKLEDAERDLNLVMSERLNLPLRLQQKILAYGRRLSSSAPSRIVVNNKSSLVFSMIEISSYDFPGLLFTLTDTLFKCGVNVWVAKIATKGDRVYDVFYVKDFDDQKISSPEQIAAIKFAVKKALPK